MEALDVSKIDLGPCTITFGGSELGRTSGETTFEYSLDTYELETEEDGTIDEIVSKDSLTVTIPLIYTDVETLAKIIPWSNLVVNADGNKKLVIGKAIGKRLYDYAKELVMHPNSQADNDKSKDLTVFKCYPKPGPLSFTYSREGRRIANVTFNAVRDSSKDEGYDYFCIGNPAIVSA